MEAARSVGAEAEWHAELVQTTGVGQVGGNGGLGGSARDAFEQMRRQDLAEVLRGFRIPAGIVLNRADMHGPSRDRLLNWLDQENLPLLAEIPYDPLLPQALAQGGLGVVMHPDAPSSIAIKKVSAAIEAMLD